MLGRSRSFALLSLCHSSAAGYIQRSAISSAFSSRRRGILAAGFVAGSLATQPRQFASADAPRTACSMAESQPLMTGYLNAADAAALDEELMSTPGFSLEQLMELAGLAVAEAAYQVVSPTSTAPNKPKILLICGPGNNGGDGLVAARHLVLFGYECSIVYPKQSKRTHFINLVKQCEDVGIEILEDMPETESYNLIIDAIFGFSFHGAPRPPFDTILKQMKHAQETTSIPVLSVDVPSGWNVDEGDVAETGFVPDVLVSLTTPKHSSKSFKGRHFVGGRFLPPAMAKKYNVRMPPYPGVSQVMDVTNLRAVQSAPVASSSSSWEQEYMEYLAEKEAPFFNGSEEKESDKSKPSTDADAEDWAAQYADYCAEKEAKLAVEDAKRAEEARRKQD